MKNARDVVDADLAGLRAALSGELARLAGKHVLIVGGAGFLGYYLVQTLTSANRLGAVQPKIRVTVWDSYARGLPAWLAALEGEPQLSLEQRSVTDPIGPDAGDFDYVVHAASIASPTYYKRHPIETMDANVNGLRNLLEYARRQADRARPLSGFLFFSSSEIYGDPPADAIPTPETYRGNVSCTGPRACYDESKRFGETLCVNFAQVHGVPVTMARPFNNIGPGLKISDRRVLPDFARDVLAGRPIEMLSDGGPRRTYCYVGDAIAGYYKILVRGRPGEPYNVGPESPEISVAELAERVARTAAELFGYRGGVIRARSTDATYLADNPVRRCPTIAKAREELGYAPAISLDDALRRSLLWYRDHPSAGDQ
ncbi:MAG: NAD-dependent epimerase/dehydratase family protein [Deltaproteobacteria bacterium]|nr:NAD-dependent epimerase/dehydratase family protein [Deltaproteobacteria bacterium]